MKSLFSAESIAVFGVSESRHNNAKNILANLINFGYRGKIYAIGLHGGEVFGYPIYRSVTELPENPELAVILTPAQFVPDILSQCGQRGTRWAVIESGGFRELGAEGEALEAEILRISREFGIRFVGPNCIGIVNTANGLYTPFNSFPSPYKKGNVAVFAQSGGVGLSFAERLCTSGLGISKLVSMGNKISADEVDFLDYLKDDPDTAVIYFYLEDFKRGRAFADLARRCCKPIILHKSNTSSLSNAIAQSHTAALAVDDQIVDAVCMESGVFRVRSVSEAINTAKGLCLPMLKGNRLAIISRSGGQAVVAADVCARYGFQLPALGQDILDEAKSRSRAGVIRFGNPLDLGDISHLSFFSNVVEKALRQPDIDGVIFIQVSLMSIEREVTRQLLEKLSALSIQYEKPVAVVLEIPLEERVFLKKISDFPFFHEPTAGVHAVAVQYQQYRKLNREKPVISDDAAPAIHLNNTAKWFDGIKEKKQQPLLHETFDLLGKMGIPSPLWHMAVSLDETIDAVKKIGFPVALKAVSPSLLHKSDRGGIALNICDAESLEAEWKRLQAVSDDVAGIVVQRMISASRELIIGGKRDASFGPIVVVGLGGIMVEVMKDVSMRLAPIDINMALKMIRDLSGARILGQFRGMQEADLHAAARILVQVSLLMHHFPQVREMDLNPVSLNDSGVGAVALDARLVLSIE